MNHILETNSNSVIINVINFLYNPQPDDARQSPKLLQLINLTAVAIKRLIKMAKKISAFRDMCQEDQVALLKGGCTEMMIMRSVMIYDNDRCAWKVNDICIIYIYITVYRINHLAGAAYQREYGQYTHRSIKVCQRECL